MTAIPAPATPFRGTGEPDLSVIIVTFNCCELVRQCLSTIPLGAAGRTAEVIVVDNASKDGTPAMIAAEFPDVRLIASEENLGFARGNNRGLAVARGRIVIFLNPDTEPAPGSLARLASELASDCSLAIVGPRLVYPDGSLQPSVRGFPTFGVAFLVMTKLYRVMRFLPAAKRFDGHDMDYARPRDVEQLMGACLAMPRTVIDDMRGFDERFWMWFEEVDLCLRVMQSGRRVRYIPDAVVMHRLSQSTVLLRSVATQRAYTRSLLAYWNKHHPRWQGRVLRSVSWVGTAAAHAMQTVRRFLDRSGSRYRIDVKEPGGIATGRN